MKQSFAIYGRRGINIVSMSHGPDRLGASRFHWLIGVSLALWLLANAWHWPVALSLEDEVGYVGQARLFLQGHVHPSADSPGIWRPNAQGVLSAKYPLFHPALLTPLLAISPRFAFVWGTAAALALVFIAARLLNQWGDNPIWSVLLLAHPAVTLLSRTMMADLIVSVFLLSAYLSLRARASLATVIFIAATLLAKPTGTVLIALLLVGDILSNWRGVLDREPALIRRYLICAAGVGVGAIALTTSNFIASGSPWFGYSERLGSPTFMTSHLLTSGAAHARSLLLVPPLLVIGVWPYWIRRDFGALTVIAGLVGMMSIYYFVDTGRSAIESLVLSQRLILPAVIFLTIGYLSLIANAAARLSLRTGGRFKGVIVAGLLLLPGIVGNAIASRHRRWQEPMRQALVAVGEIASSLHTDRIGLTGGALKYGLMFRGETTLQSTDAEPGRNSPSVDAEILLCATRNPSYRMNDVEVSCTTQGYRTVRKLPTCEILVRKH